MPMLRLSLSAILVLAACGSTEGGSSGGGSLGEAAPREAPSPDATSRADASGSAFSSRSGTSADASASGSARAPRRDREAPRRLPAGLLTAGDIDGNLNWAAFQRYRLQAAQATTAPALDLDDRVTIRVVDRDGQPVANARLTIEAEGGDRLAA